VADRTLHVDRDPSAGVERRQQDDQKHRHHDCEFNRSDAAGRRRKAAENVEPAHHDP
jgi:hypothetical protein